jgi:hypothetical protein
MRLESPDKIFWRTRLERCVAPRASNQVHLGIFNQPFLDLILSGRKTIETRFSRNRIDPYEAARKDDLLLLKQSSGPVVGLCLLDHPGYYELDEAARKLIPERFGEQICATNSKFWEERQHARYASLLPIKAVIAIEPFRVAKRDRRGWVVLHSLRASPPATTDELCIWGDTAAL